MPKRLPGISDKDFVPAYRLLSEDELSSKAQSAIEMLTACHLCPRRCGMDRTKGETGFCRVLDKPFVSSWGPHFGEEPPLVGRRGSGTIFFGGCNLGCVFCQNWDISHGCEGKEMSFTELAGVMLELAHMGCHNINLVTPTHQMPIFLKSLVTARKKGLNLPIVYNCGGYESQEALKILDGVVDIYMPDFKYTSSEVAVRFSDAPNYPDVAKAALEEMHRQVGDLVVNERGVAKRGLIVRHLVLPEGLAGTEEAMRFIAEEISRNTYINIMDQYRPCYRASEFPLLTRGITAAEYEEAVQTALRMGLKRLANLSAL